MKKLSVLLLASGLAWLAACGSGKTSGGPPSDGGTGGTTATGGSSAGGTAGVATGGTGGSATGGSAGASGGAAGAGGGPACTTAADCPGVDTTCLYRVCITNTCGTDTAVQGTACSESGGAVCDGAGNCVECNTNSDCAQGVCSSHQCVSATCTDKVKNGDETDVDCGGSCAPCVDGKQCQAAKDCESAFCSSGVCTACGSDSDCASSEYCSSGKCQPKKTGGSNCSAAKECQSGFCPSEDGVCCDAACGSTCQACLATKTGDANGTCAPVTAGNDPDNECSASGSSTCGANGTGCNGSASSPGCNLYPSGTQCAAGSCSGGSATAPSSCNGNGTCVAPSPASCSPYACSGDACATSCSSNASCASNAYCTSNKCQPKQGNGQSCTAGSQCTSGYCVDGVCCNTTCGGACDACNLSGKAGTCSPVASGQPGSPSCSPYVCNGSSASCPSGCTSNANCASGQCLGGKCLVKCLAANENTTLNNYVDNANVFGLPFTPTSTMKVRRIEIYTGNGPGASQTTLALRADAAGLPGTTLATGSFTVSAANAWQGVDITVTTLSPGTQYWLYYAGSDGSYFPIGGTDLKTHWYSSNGGSSWNGPYTSAAWKYVLWCEP